MCLMERWHSDGAVFCPDYRFQAADLRIWFLFLWVLAVVNEIGEVDNSSCGRRILAKSAVAADSLQIGLSALQIGFTSPKIGLTAVQIEFTALQIDLTAVQIDIPRVRFEITARSISMPNGFSARARCALAGFMAIRSAAR